MCECELLRGLVQDREGSLGILGGHRGVEQVGDVGAPDRSRIAMTRAKRAIEGLQAAREQRGAFVDAVRFIERGRLDALGQGDVGVAFGVMLTRRRRSLGSQLEGFVEEQRN